MTPPEAPSALPPRGAAPSGPAEPVPRRRLGGDPVLPFAPETLLRAQGAGLGTNLGMRAAIFDVDGVLTDGSLWIGEAGELFKPFHALDGHGLKLLKQGGIEPLVITGRDSPAVRRRLADLGIVHAAFGAADKLAAADRLMQTLGLDWPSLAVMGDDWPDLPLLERAGFACAPPGAHAEVLAVVHHVTAARGGHGAAREFCDLLLMASGRYAALLAQERRTLDGR